MAFESLKVKSVVECESNVFGRLTELVDGKPDAWGKVTVLGSGCACTEENGGCVFAGSGDVIIRGGSVRRELVGYPHTFPLVGPCTECGVDVVGREHGQGDLFTHHCVEVCVTSCGGVTVTSESVGIGCRSCGLCESSVCGECRSIEIVDKLIRCLSGFRVVGIKFTT